MLEGDDDTVSLLQEKEIDNLAGETKRLHSHTRTHTHTLGTQGRINCLRLLFLVRIRPRLFTSKGKCAIRSVAAALI